MALAKVPSPVPSVVSVSAMVGLIVVLQQIPRAVTAAPPLEVTLPPPVAVAEVIPVIAVVVTEGMVRGLVVVADTTALKSLITILLL